MILPPQLRCPVHGQGLEPFAETGGPDRLRCAQGCVYPIVAGVPRFVEGVNYAAAFGRQWNRFRRTQLDSHTGTSISRDRLTRCLGGSMEIVRGRWVLEAGCGAGRFTEVLLDSGAHVFACDLSSAVEANAANFHGREHHFVCQGDIYSLPVAESSFEVVICLGVLQHTPYPETAIESLAKAVKPGGMLVIDHYSPAYHQPLQRRLLRALLLSLPQRLHTPLALGLGHSILPLHRMLWHRPRYHRIWSRLRTLLHRFSPLVDYHASYPELDERILAEWCILDTHDTLTDRYKHLRDADAIRHALSNSGLEVLSCADGGNGIEARAVRRL